jgi:hypothetical protein
MIEVFSASPFVLTRSVQLNGSRQELTMDKVRFELLSNCKVVK